MSEDDISVTQNEAEALQIGSRQPLDEEMREILTTSDDDDVIRVTTASHITSSWDSQHAPVVA
jgi:hypothetical protein